MSDIAKWAILVAGVATLVIMVLTLPFAVYVADTTALANGISVIMQYAGSSLYKARAVVNLFLLPIGRDILSGLIVYLFIGWASKLTIKITTWVFHFIFK